MPKMTDQQTGETKEISMEEFMEIVRQSGGKGSLQQIVTDANGNKTVTDTQAWNYAVGMINVVGLEPTPEFKEYIEKEKRARSRWMISSSILIKDIK